MLKDNSTTFFFFLNCYTFFFLFFIFLSFFFFIVDNYNVLVIFNIDTKNVNGNFSLFLFFLVIRKESSTGGVKIPGASRKS